MSDKTRRHLRLTGTRWIISRRARWTAQRTRVIVSLLFVLVCAVFVSAQDSAADTTRDPAALAARYLADDGTPHVPPLSPRFAVGDRLEFWVGKDDIPIRVSATLAAASPSIYLWVEDGLDYSVPQMSSLAAQVSTVYDIFQLRENYSQPLFFPGQGAVSDPTARMSVPDVDNDPHLYVLYTTDLNEDRDSLFNPNDSQPVALVPSGYSNQHEVLYVNTTPYPNVPLHDGLYFNTLIGILHPFIMSHNNPAQAPWLVEALNLSLRFTLQQTTITAQDARAFLDTPGTALLRQPQVTNRMQTVNGQQLFLNYLLQRYGIQLYLDLFLEPGEGITPLDAALLKNDIIDPVTGAPVTGRDAFADFVLANLINLPTGDLRYVHRITPTGDNQHAFSTLIPDLRRGSLSGQTVNQFGTVYLHYTAQAAENVSFAFEGDAAVARLRLPDDFDSSDEFYWSGRAPDQDTTMTRAFDLRSVNEATLTFDVWHDLAANWNYGYVSLSTDSGETWIPLPSTSAEQGTTATNRYGLAFGPGYTGVSSPAAPRPFPIMGVIIAQDGMTLGEITPDSPAAEAGLRQGDRIIGYDGAVWSATPDVIGLLGSYAPGDTLNLYVERGIQRLDVPLVLAEHPTRVIQPDPLWLPQTVDLTPFTGLEVELRFEYVSLPGRENDGIAVNNIAIPEIDYADDDGWTLNGWQVVTNTLPQQWLVQSVTSGSEATSLRVRPLIGVGSGETSGEWTFSLQPSETVLFAISALNDDTYQPTAFNAALREG